MSKKTQSGGNEDAVTWAKEVLDAAVQEIMGRGAVNATLIEAKPLWALPYEVMIGQIRDSSEHTASIWIIAGQVPTDHVGTDIAPTAREAARHFALKWQLDAARYRDPAVQKKFGAGPGMKDSWEQRGERLAFKAEALFELVEDDNLWQESPIS